MVTQAKIDANRQNAKKSTGPRTPSGKAIASMNAVKHGLSSRKPLIPGEDEAEFAQFTSDWVNELRPFGPRERLAAEQAIMAAWRLRRVPQLEAGLLAAEIHVDSNRMKPVHPFAMGSSAYQELSRIDRHQAALERTLDRSIKELERLQAERGEDETTDYTDYADEQNEANGGEGLLMEQDTMNSHENPASTHLPASGGSDPGQAGHGLVD